MKKKAFTLIELIAVLVILAILALIVTPLVMNIIRKARISADKRSVDVYGRSIELAIAGYLLDTGKFPTEVSQLTIEYSGNEVVCSTTQLNSDSSVYLAGCSVEGRSVEGYTYGSEEIVTYDAYQVGDHVSYNGVTYYVIEDSDTTNDTVKLLKESLLKYNDVGIVPEEYQGDTLSTWSSETDIQQKMNIWASTAIKKGDTVKLRLITIDELLDNLGYVVGTMATSYNITPDVTPIWVYEGLDLSCYWTNNLVESWCVEENYVGIYNGNCGVRPVIELNKSADITKLTS